MDVHVRGAVFCAAAAARHMSAAGHGRIVLLSSVNGLHSEPDTVDYSAAKAAIISVARTLAVELAGSGVSANAVAPGWIETPQTQAIVDNRSRYDAVVGRTPLGRWGRPAEQLDGDELQEAVALQAAYLAAGLRDLAGVHRRRWFQRRRVQLVARLHHRRRHTPPGDHRAVRVAGAVDDGRDRFR